MTDISSQHNENSDGEVCENSFDNQIIILIDSPNNLQEDYYKYSLGSSKNYFLGRDEPP